MSHFNSFDKGVSSESPTDNAKLGAVMKTVSRVLAAFLPGLLNGFKYLLKFDWVKEIAELIRELIEIGKIFDERDPVFKEKLMIRLILHAFYFQPGGVDAEAVYLFVDEPLDGLRGEIGALVRLGRAEAPAGVGADEHNVAFFDAHWCSLTIF